MLWKVTELVAACLKELMVIISKEELANSPLAAAIACFSVCIMETPLRKAGICLFLSVAHLSQSWNMSLCFPIVGHPGGTLSILPKM